MIIFKSFLTALKWAPFIEAARAVEEIGLSQTTITNFICLPRSVKTLKVSFEVRLPKVVTCVFFALTLVSSGLKQRKY